MSRESVESIAFLPPGAGVDAFQNSHFVAVVKTRAEFHRWLSVADPGLQAIEVRELLTDPEAWGMAAQGRMPVPVDVIVGDPAKEFSALYRLVDVSLARPVRVTIPANQPGFMKAVKLASALRLPVRLLPGQPTPDAAAELMEAAEFYLHNPMVETPIEFFHSALATFRGFSTGNLWTVLEQDPAHFVRHDELGLRSPPPDFVDRYLADMTANDAECGSFASRQFCAGYFQWPDPDYDCTGVMKVLDFLQSAAEEIGMDLEEGEMLLIS